MTLRPFTLRPANHPFTKYLAVGSVICTLVAMLPQKSAAQQGEGGGKKFEFTPYVSVTETLTNNVNLSTVKQSDSVTELSPGIRVSSNYGRLKGSVDYSLTQLIYLNNSSKNNLQNTLNAGGIYEAVDNFAFVEFSGSINQQSISAFGTPSISNANINSNKTEVATYKVSPFLRGRLSSFADYEARYTATTSRSKSSNASDVDNQEALLRTFGNTPFRQVKWTLDLNHQIVDYSAGRKTTSDLVRGTVGYSINPQLDVTLIVGRESNDYVSLQKETHGSTGFGFNWRPSDTTRLSAETEHRYFGNTHTVTFEHRTPRTAWTYSDSRGVSTLNGPGTGIGSTSGIAGGLYDLLFLQFASIEPDPIRRAQLVTSFLQANGLSTTPSTVNGYLTSGLSLQQSRALTFALLGIRDTVTFTLSRSTGETLGSVTTTADDFAQSNFVKQNGFTVSYSHRFSQEASLNVLLARQNSSGALGLGNTLKSMNINLSTRLTDKVYTNVGARHVISDGNNSPYRETAVTGSVNIQF